MPLPKGYTLDSGSNAASSGPSVKLPAGYALDSSSGDTNTGDANTAQGQMDRALNYRSGNVALDAPLGVLQGLAKGAISTAYGAVDLANKVVPHPVEFNQDTRKQLTEANGIGQGTGKFAEQAAEFMTPEAILEKLGVKATGALAKIGLKSLTGGTVSAVQSGGDVQSTLLGAAMPVAGEAMSAALKPGLVNLVNSQAAKAAAKVAPTLQNFSNAFGQASPTQKEAITAALPTLVGDGIAPGASIKEMKSAVQGRLDDLGQQYSNLPKAVTERPVNTADVVQALTDKQKSFERNGVVTRASQASWDAVEQEIKDVQSLANANPNGTLTVGDLTHLKQGANGQLSPTATAGAKSLNIALGNVYRKAIDQAAPELADLNRSYHHYVNLNDILDTNISRGKDVMAGEPSNTAKALTSLPAMAAIAGHNPALAIGYAALPDSTKLSLANAIDSGVVSRMSPVLQASLNAAITAGQSVHVRAILQTIATKRQ